MQSITHYEVYQAGSGQWTMVARFTGSERDIAMAHARGLEADFKQPVAIVEEIEDLASAQFDVRLIHRTASAGGNIGVPSNASDLGSRFFMITLSGLTIGAISFVIGAVLLSRMGLSSGIFNLSVTGIFLGASLLGGLLLFRVYIPVGVILWRSKDPESRKRTILALAQGQVVAPMPEAAQVAAPAPPPEAPPADGFQTSPTMADAAHENAATVPPTLDTPPESPAATPTETADPAPVATDSAVATNSPTPPPRTATEVSKEISSALVERTRAILAMFADNGVAALRPSRPTLSVTDRLGFSLYLLGATQEVAARNGLDEATTRTLAVDVLGRTRLMPEEVELFLADYAANGVRSRYRAMIENGTKAIGGQLGDPNPPRTQLVEILSRWSDVQNQGVEAQQTTFLLTDLVGSTALTSEIGNAGAQRIVRAHNAICRAATKAYRGREVKHTGDGMLIVFPDSTAGARAAIDIQQEANNFTLDNPTAPLSLRVGVHTGDAVYEDGEYFGQGVATVNGVTAMANGGEIYCSAAVRQKLPTLLKAQEIDTRPVKGSPVPIQLFKLLWEPKRGAPKPMLEYRQIGTNPAAPPGAPPGAPTGNERR